MDTTFEKLLELVKLNQDNPDVLSKLVVEIASLLYTHNQLIAQTDLDEKRVVVGFLDSKKDDGKGYSVAESEVRAEVQTDNAYKLRKLEGDAVIEVINSIKKRLDILQFERKSNV